MARRSSSAVESPLEPSGQRRMNPGGRARRRHAFHRDLAGAAPAGADTTIRRPAFDPETSLRSREITITVASAPLDKVYLGIS